MEDGDGHVSTLIALGYKIVCNLINKLIKYNYYLARNILIHKPLNNRHFGTSSFYCYTGVVLFKT